MFWLSAQNNSYIIMSSYEKSLFLKKFKSKFHIFGWFPEQDLKSFRQK